MEEIWKKARFSVGLGATEWLAGLKPGGHAGEKQIPHPQKRRVRDDIERVEPTGHYGARIGGKER